MIQSMTAFARVEHQANRGMILCEIRSINQRYLDIAIHLPESLRVFEMAIRDRIRRTINRGKIDCTLRYQPVNTADNTTLPINIALVRSLCKTSENIASYLTNASPIDPMAILQFPGVLENTAVDVSGLQEEVLSLLDKSLNELILTRKREGEELKQLFLTRIAAMQGELSKVREQLPKLMGEVNERLIKRFTEASINLDPSRLEQEMVIFTHKIDIAEEIDRTETHLTEVTRVLEQGGPAGRRLDFLMQELNREANTLGSKSVDTVITHAAVEMKVLIEQIREQVQNVE